MRIVRAELRRVDIPFRQHFAHAAETRERAERIFVILRDRDGHAGVGEILPRPYLTGESLEAVFERTAPGHAASLIGRRFADQAALLAYLDDALRAAGRDLAMIGGFEAALINLAERVFGGFDFSAVLGPPRATPAGRCVTIGLGDDRKTLRREAMAARLAGATVVKAKVRGPEDAARILDLRPFSASCRCASMPMAASRSRARTRCSASCAVRRCSRSSSRCPPASRISRPGSSACSANMACR
jgi:L-alanine-DL-glutamate epimerase-like enolase superfamily enzyme